MSKNPPKILKSCKNPPTLPTGVHKKPNVYFEDLLMTSSWFYHYTTQTQTFFIFDFFSNMAPDEREVCCFISFPSLNYK